jgi:glycosyltransferase involved in cell wall biosynthesis
MIKRDYPNLGVSILQRWRNKFQAKIAYCLFFNNLKKFYRIFEYKKIPFVFTLYPGGGFELYNEEKNGFLRIINKSNYFKGVIVNQKVTKKYLTENSIIDKEKIFLINGIPVASSKLNASIHNKRYYGINKATFDIAFVANKYTYNGADKGFDFFCQLIRRLIYKSPDIRVHVVGNFSESDLEKKDSNYIKFYGTRDPDFFESFYRNIDVLVSPNKPFVLSPGAFDGFPPGAAVDAGIAGVMLLLTDYLNENDFLLDGVDYININSGIDYAEKIISDLIANPDQLKAIGTNGRQKFLTHYSYEAQIKSRVKIFKAIIND